MPVEIVAEDLLRLGLIGEDELRGSPKKIFKRLSKEGILKSYRGSTAIHVSAKEQRRLYFPRGRQAVHSL